MLQGKVEVGHATFKNRFDQCARESRRVQVEESHPIDFATQRLGQFNEWLGATFVEHFDRLTTTTSTSVVSPTREILGDQDQFAHTTFGEQNGAKLRGGNALHPTSSATSLRHDSSGKLVVTDGAFAETKEALGGYYVIEAADLDEAIAIAAQVPASFGGVEVRPIRVFD